MNEPVLYDYWRSSASYRVRIALNLLGIVYKTVPIDLSQNEHLNDEYLTINPQGLVPALAIDGNVFTQSLSIIEYLAETRPNSLFLPSDPVARQHVRSLAYAIAMDIHPVCNMRVASYLVQLSGHETDRKTWMNNFISSGLSAIERTLESSNNNQFCFGMHPTMADLCLVPQVYNARRWGVDVSVYPRILEIDRAANVLTAFQAAHPDFAKPAY